MGTKFFNIKALSVLVIVCINLFASAQQDPLYSQYVFNKQVINPAYAGTWESVGFTVMARQNYENFDLAPQTFTVSMQAPLTNKKTGVGLNIIHEKIGFEKRFCAFGDYSYLTKLNGKTNLRLGIKGGFTNYSSYSNEHLLKSDAIDPFNGQQIKQSMINVGAGAFLYSSKYYVGFSVPKILNNKFEEAYDGFALSCEHQHYYLMSGLIINLGRNLLFKPATLAKATFTTETGSPAEINITANFLIKERLWLGAMYRTTDSFGFMAQWLVTGNLRLGYIHDTIASNIDNQYSGSHEIMVSYELASLRNSFGTPRYF